MLLSYTDVADVFQFRMNLDVICCYTVTAGNGFVLNCSFVSIGGGVGVTSLVPRNCITLRNVGRTYHSRSHFCYH
jgi:hypothetical protein